MPRAADRAQAYLLLVAAGTVILVAMLIAVFEPVMSDVQNQSTSVSQTQASATGIGWVHDFWTWMPLTALLLVLVMLIAGSIFQSRRP